MGRALNTVNTEFKSRQRMNVLIRIWINSLFVNSKWRAPIWTSPSKWLRCNIPVGLITEFPMILKIFCGCTNYSGNWSVKKCPDLPPFWFIVRLELEGQEHWLAWKTSPLRYFMFCWLYICIYVYVTIIFWVDRSRSIFGGRFPHRLSHERGSSNYGNVDHSIQKHNH